MAGPSIELSAVAIKRLMKFLGKVDVYEGFKVPKAGRKAPAVLTEEEILRIENAAEDPMWRAVVVLVLYESGAKAGELLALKVGDVSFDRYGAKIILRGKTGERPARLT